MRLLIGTILAVAVMALLQALPAAAETASGLWLTGPDGKGQVGHVKMAPCGPALCGTVIKAFDSAGKPVLTPNVGKRVIWDVKPAGAGNFAGRMHVSQLKADVAGQFRVSGRAMTVKGCLGKLCQSQKWTKLD